MFAARDWLIEHIPEDAVVGSFNSGIYSYYCDFRVVNLDGVVNNRAFEAIRESRILDYLVKDGVDYVIDSDNAIRNEYGPFFGADSPVLLEELEVIEADSAQVFGELRVYRVVSAFDASYRPAAGLWKLSQHPVLGGLSVASVRLNGWLP